VVLYIKELRSFDCANGKLYVGHFKFGKLITESCQITTNSYSDFDIVD